MKDNRERNYLNFLSENEYISSEDIALKLDVSGRTVRNELKELNQVLKMHGAKIVRKPKCGNILIVENREAYQDYLSQINDITSHKIPKTSEERVKFLMEYLLQSYSYIKIEDLCNLLYVSKTSLSLDLKQVREQLREYNLKLNTKPNHGIKVEGSEFDLRLCLANYAMDNTGVLQSDLEKSQRIEWLKLIANILTYSFENESYSISDTAFQNLIIHIYTALRRVQGNNYVPIDYQIKELVKEKELNLAKGILQKLENSFNISVPNDEVYYIAIHLAAKETIYEGKSTQNRVISEEINNIVLNMLKEVKETYKINFFDDLELRMVLALHLIPFQVRMEYSLILHNPIIKEIKTRATLAYNIAVSACNILEKTYGKSVSDSEIGYFALHFNLALERKKKIVNKKNIVIVCGSGRGTAKLLCYKFQEEFDKYLNKVITTDILNLKNINFKNIDYVITTVPINFTIPVPILETTYFLEDLELETIREFFKKNSNKSLLDFFDPKLYTTNVDFSSKEEVIKYMVKQIKQVKTGIPDDFYEAIMKREKLSPTEFGNMVALPHPYKVLTENTFISLVILNKPIVWNKKKVQLIYLMSITNKEDRDLQYIYKVTSKLFTNKKYIKDLIQNKDYNIFCSIIKEIERTI
ncbi:putative licABCH operon regulator [Clostridium puniceum]|uniref:Putative licABCH operon regulator n=1 Tax=Clostridium puniceum TaxID=29367 RepID=A0A1S8T877_9CLOT|nr:BglG family transcription antiterminator [Clostridium puniceum]OOM73665.1 putative licABCH operon regulator [Clostridium puniceum]